MTIKDLIRKKELSVYRLSAMSGVPYSTLTDIVNGKTRLERCSAETVFKLSKALDVPMETLLEPCFRKRSSFELFKSSVCHRVKELGDVDFIIETLEEDTIRDYYERKWYPECFYLLAMLDYISRMNEVPICNKYNDLRRLKLSETIYPESVVAASAVFQNRRIKEETCKSAIPEFMRFNIVECEVRDVI